MGRCEQNGGPNDCCYCRGIELDNDVALPKKPGRKFSHHQRDAPVALFGQSWLLYLLLPRALRPQIRVLRGEMKRRSGRCC